MSFSLFSKYLSFYCGFFFNTLVALKYVISTTFWVFQFYFCYCCGAVSQSCLTLQPHGLEYASPPCPSPSPKVSPSSFPLHQWCHPAISCSEHPLLLLPSIFASIREFSNELALCIIWPKYWSFSFSISPFSEYSGLISLRLTGLISLLSKEISQESSPVPQFEGINSLALCLLNGPALTTIHDHREDHT